MSSQPNLSERNARFVERFDHADLTMRPKLSLIVLTCMDSRVDPSRFLELDVGDVLGLRNVGGRVTDDVILSVSMAWAMVSRLTEPAPPGLSLAIVHHTDCGLEKLADDATRADLAQRSGVSGEALSGMAIRDHAAAFQEDLDALRASPHIPAELVVSCHVYDPRTGVLTLSAAPAALGG
jgi:carbonic anhydrase